MCEYKHDHVQDMRLALTIVAVVICKTRIDSKIIGYRITKERVASIHKRPVEIDSLSVAIKH